MMMQKISRIYWLITVVILFLLALASMQFLRVSASVLNPVSESDSFLYSEIPLNDAVLTKGKGILYSPTYAEVKINDLYTIHFLQGAIYIVRNDSQFTVAALTTPALLYDSRGESVLLPSGTQVTITTPHLPDSTVLTRWWNSMNISVVSQKFIASALERLPQSRPVLRSLQDETHLALESLSNCDSFSCKNKVLSVLATTTHSTVAEMIIQHLSLYSEAISILAFARQTTATTITEQQVSGKHILTIFYGCIYTNCSSEFLHALEYATKNYVIEKGISEEFLQTLMRFADAYTNHEYALAYPYRYQQLQQFLRDVSLPYVDILSLKIPRIPIALPSSSSSSSSLPLITVGVYTESELIDRAREILGRLEAMYTVHTTITPVAINTVRIDSIALPTGAGDMLFSLTLQVKTGEISSISTGNTTYPNTVLLEDFVLWLKNFS